MTTPKAPAGTRAAGARLWHSVLAVYDLEEHEVALLREMVRTVDLLDQLHAAAAGAKTDGARVHPAIVEARMQRIALARLGAALRLPAGEEDDVQQGARRPQRRVGVRGAYRPQVVK
jgi:hypothetical protein